MLLWGERRARLLCCYFMFVIRKQSWKRTRPLFCVEQYNVVVQFCALQREKSMSMVNRLRDTFEVDAGDAFNENNNKIPSVSQVVCDNSQQQPDEITFNSCCRSHLHDWTFFSPLGSIRIWFACEKYASRVQVGSLKKCLLERYHATSDTRSTYNKHRFNRQSTRLEQQQPPISSVCAEKKYKESEWVSAKACN